MEFTFCIDVQHNTIQLQRNRVHFAHNMFIIGLGAVVLLIIGYIWYLVAYDAPLPTVPSSVDATTAAVAYLLSFHAPLHGYRLGSFITMTHIRILDSLFMAFVAILFISGGLLALRATELAINSSFSALSVLILVLLIGLLSLAVIIFRFIAVMCITRIRAFVTFILFVGEVLALGTAMMAVFSSILACVRCIYFGIIYGFICLGCICLVLDAICIVSPQRILCIAIGEAGFALGVSVAFGASLTAFVACIWHYIYLHVVMGFVLMHLSRIFAHRVFAHSTDAQDIAGPHVASEQRDCITVIAEKGACIALRCALCFCI